MQIPFIHQIMTRLESNLSQLKAFLAHLATIKGDLSNVTAPPFVLAPKSAIEVPICWAARQRLFLQPALEDDPARRALLLVKNFACSLAGLVELGSEYAGKKPLNPFLGELFLGTFLPATAAAAAATENGFHAYGDGDGDTEGTRFIGEQVSHHPPVTACFAYNRHHGITSRGFAAQETSFSPASGVTVRQVGYAVIGDHVHGETHLMTLPTVHVRGIATGTLHPELHGRCWISSSSGFVTSVDLEGKGTLGLLGAGNKITAVVHRLPGMEPVYKITGQWSGEMTVENLQSHEKERFQFDDVPATELSVAPTADQTAWESRRAWDEVLRGIREGDMGLITEHKTAIEEEQRRRRREEKETGTSWTGLFFRRSERDDEAAALLGQIPDGDGEFDPERTAGFWQFVGVDAAEELRTRLK